MQKITSRIAYMDALRAVLMLLGVVIHASQIYNPEKSWLIYSDQSHVIFEKLIDFVSGFRMPAFFIVSGYFSFLLLQNSPGSKFIVGRFERLIIPLAIGLLTLNIPIAILLSDLGWLNTDLSLFLIEGGWRQHLWFLGNLFVYSVILSFLFTSNILISLFSRLDDFSNYFGCFVVVCLLPLMHVFILSLNKFGIPIYISYLGISLYDLMYYLPFFIFGAYLRHDLSIFESFTSGKVVASVIGFLILVSVVEASVPISGSSVIERVLSIYNKVLLAWCLSMICFYVFKKMLTKESKLWKELANSSYSVYIFHQPVIVLIGLVVIKLSLPPMLGFLILVIATFAVTLLLHYQLVKRFDLLEYMYNGKRNSNVKKLR